MFELFLSKTPTKEANPATARQARHPAKKFSSYFLICARRFFSSKRKRKLFFEVLLLTSRTAGLSSFCIRSGVAEFPPHLPSASPSLPTAFFSVGLESVFCKAKYATRDDVALAPTHPCAGNDKELPFCFTISKYFGNIILWLRSLSIIQLYHNLILLFKYGRVKQNQTHKRKNGVIARETGPACRCFQQYNNQHRGGQTAKPDS